MTDVICIVCPKGCHLRVDEEHDFAVTGNLCPRGVTYGRDELKNPVRFVTSTVKITGAALRRCPVRTKAAIPKGLIFEAIRLLDNVELCAPVAEGAIVVPDICGTGIPWVTTRDMGEK